MVLNAACTRSRRAASFAVALPFLSFPSNRVASLRSSPSVMLSIWQLWYFINEAGYEKRGSCAGFYVPSISFICDRAGLS